MSHCLVLLLLVASTWHACQGWTAPPTFSFGRSNRGTSCWEKTTQYEDGEVGQGPNWIEKSFPVGTGEKIDPKKIDDYNVGVSGEAFQTGPLSKRMFDAICSRTSLEMSDEIKQAFRIYAMDFTAKEATRAALEQNGLQMVLAEEEEDQGMWGDVDSVRLYDVSTGMALSTLYDSFEDAVNDWEPGQAFDFVARQVPAKIKEMSMEELMEALDPDGSLRKEAESMRGEGNVTLDEEAVSAIFDDYELSSLEDLANENIRRVEAAPREAVIEADAFAGKESRGYRVVYQSDLSKSNKNKDGTENEKVTMHVMNALVSHGVVLVDLTDGGASFSKAQTVAKMWSTTSEFFQNVVNANETGLPGLVTAAETGSKQAKAGYVTYDNGSMRFLETRRKRNSGEFIPMEALGFLGDNGDEALAAAFDMLAQVGKDVVRIAVTASTVEHGGFVEMQDVMDEETQNIIASEAASLLVKELVDDNKKLPVTEILHNEGSVGMSPHRLCQYSDQVVSEKTAREVFGAHTDSSFVTIIPVAATSGLEVFDEEAEEWYRPELRARQVWEAEQVQKGKDPSATVELLEDGTEIPWHARYVCILPGEHLQLSTRDEVSASVHRVVAARNSSSRLSAPVLLRGRPGVVFDCNRYLGGSLGNPLLQECDGKTMDDIYTATQPTSFQ